ncbi:MAG: response regulator transcription factor, partial [Chloroflexota bacterium]
MRSCPGANGEVTGGRISMTVTQHPTILVVDDEIAIVKVMRDFLEAEGFAVLAAHDGAEALAALTRERVDCLLLD